MIYKFMKNNKKFEKKTVLIIDHDREWINEVKNYLELIDFKVIFLRIPEEMKLLNPVLKERNIDVILSEIKMPGWDGFSMAKSLKENFGGKLKIALTAKTIENNHKAKALAYRADCLIPKTKDKKFLASELKRIIKFSV